LRIVNMSVDARAMAALQKKKSSGAGGGFEKCGKKERLVVVAVIACTGFKEFDYFSEVLIITD
ncbi:MAG: hypothetical protein LPK19_13560, partial [Hymenobacteraceae bacterium]|nr:hypothetical protein [Hymenobacteraceae bacterium]MDX5397252.1 hypothetical protein [Hymenobacteraceae bacterium]MDX5513330.1 hypothetical protein [Hymenobacteraceae bacterium]